MAYKNHSTVKMYTNIEDSYDHIKAEKHHGVKNSNNICKFL